MRDTTPLAPVTDPQICAEARDLPVVADLEGDGRRIRLEGLATVTSSRAC